MVGVLFFFTARDENYEDKLSPHPDVVVNVIGYQWSWQFQYPQYKVPTSPLGVVAENGEPLSLIHIFYPFAPLDGERRDNALELQVRGQIGSDLKIEPDLSRWFPVWGAPGL